MAWAEWVTIQQPSSLRVEPKCIYYGKCGGCDFQHIAYANQIKIKKDLVAEALGRILAEKMPSEIKVYTSKTEFAYRNRVGLRQSGIQIGYFAKKSNDIVDIKKCLIAEDLVNDQILELRNKFLNNSKNTKESTVTVYSDHYEIKNSKPINPQSQNSGLAKKMTQAKGHQKLIINSNKTGDESKNKSSNSSNPNHIEIDNDLADGAQNDFEAFSQVNSEVNQLLVSEIVDQIKAINPLYVLDLYSGEGNFLLPILKNVSKNCHIEGVEWNTESVAKGQKKLGDLGISPKRAVFYKNKVLNYLNFINPIESRPFVIVLDPPRSGVESGVMNIIQKLNPDFIFYISCNVTTLARDLQQLISFNNQNNIESVDLKIFDMFPQTSHIETLAIVKLQKKLR